ncbi:hypothetical protein EDD11_008818 [Mortierella claussenii]|nr:hypothetical protein EDD11_008818 [Mortierella claussenii]
MHPPSGQHSQDGAPVMKQVWPMPCRYWIILLSGLGLMISYADRSNMAVAIVAIAHEYGYTKAQQGLILATFFVGYILTPVIGGTLADRYGGKPVLALGAFAWTVFTLLTPAASSAGLVWIVLARIALGLGEGVAYPSIHAMIGVWIPPCERSKAVATIWGASDPASSPWITEQERHWILQQQQLDQQGVADETSQQHVIVARDSGDASSTDFEQEQIRTAVDARGTPVTYQSLSPGDFAHQQDMETRGSEDSEIEILAASSSHHLRIEENELISRSASNQSLTQGQQTTVQNSRWQAFRNKMRSKRRDAGGIRKKEPVPWKTLLAQREVWAIILSQLFNSLGFFIMQSWLPSFYLDYYGVDVGKIGFYAVAPSVAQGVVGLTAGYLGDKASQDWHWSTLMVRRVGQSVGSLGLGVFLMIAVSFAKTAPLAMVLITIGMALNGFTMIGASVYQAISDDSIHIVGLSTT